MSIVHLCEQRSPEWKKARGDKFTASESGPFLLNTTKVALTAREKLVDRKLAAWAGIPKDDDYQSASMKRGVALEAVAREQYRAMLGLPCIEVGFVSHDTLPLGCSPDDLVLGSMPEEITEESIAAQIVGGCEIKAPDGDTMIRYLRNKVLPEEYTYQVHHCMAVLGCDWWDFYAMRPIILQERFTRDEYEVLEWENGILPALYIRTYRDAFTEQLLAGLKDISGEYLRQRAWLQSLCLTEISNS